MQRLARIWVKRPEIGVIFVAIALVIFFASSSKGVWLDPFNLKEVFRVTSILALLALGEAFVISTGEIDISVGSIFGVSGLTYIAFAPDIGPLLAMSLGLLAATLIGVMNGLIVAYLRIPSLVVTLGSLFMFRGLAIAATERSFSFSINRAMRENPIIRFFGGGDVNILGFDFSNAVIWAILGVILLQFIFFLTPIGNRILAVGGNAVSAASRGVRVNRIKLGVFVACAFFAGFAGVLEASDIGYVDGAFGRLMELQAIAVVVLGGTALLGGRTSIIGTLFGAFILSAVQSYLVIQGIQPQWFTLILGAMIVLVSLLDRFVQDSLVRFSK